MIRPGRPVVLPACLSPRRGTLGRLSAESRKNFTKSLQPNGPQGLTTIAGRHRYEQPVVIRRSTGGTVPGYGVLSSVMPFGNVPVETDRSHTPHSDALIVVTSYHEEGYNPQPGHGSTVARPAPAMQQVGASRYRLLEEDEEVLTVHLYWFFRRKARIMFLTAMTYAALC